MRNRTYRNFMKVMEVLVNEKHYHTAEAEDMTRVIFDNVERDTVGHNVEWYLNKIITKEEWLEQGGD